jgi:hypothetical protein
VVRQWGAMVAVAATAAAIAAAPGDARDLPRRPQGEALVGLGRLGVPGLLLDGGGGGWLPHSAVAARGGRSPPAAAEPAAPKKGIRGRRCRLRQRLAVGRIAAAAAPGTKCATTVAARVALLPRHGTARGGCCLPHNRSSSSSSLRLRLRRVRHVVCTFDNSIFLFLRRMFTFWGERKAGFLSRPRVRPTTVAIVVLRVRMMCPTNELPRPVAGPDDVHRVCACGAAAAEREREGGAFGTTSEIAVAAAFGSSFFRFVSVRPLVVSSFPFFCPQIYCVPTVATTLVDDKNGMIIGGESMINSRTQE